MRCLLPTAILAIAMTGCAGDSSRIVGIWVNINEPTSKFNRQLTLASNGQFRFITVPRTTVVAGGGPTVAAEQSYGTYSVEGGTLTLTSSTPGVQPAQFKIASLTDTTLVLSTVSGPLLITTYTRVAPAR